jgi:hypothetical protein
VYENRVLRKIFEPKRQQVAGGWRRLHKEELHNLYMSPNIIRMVKSWRLKWVGNLACMHGKYKECIQNFGWKI